MNVKEFIEELKKYPPDAKVVVTIEDFGGNAKLYPAEAELIDRHGGVVFDEKVVLIL